MKSIAVFVSPETRLTIIVSHGEVLCVDEDGETTMLHDGVYPDGEVKPLRTNWLKAAAGQGVISFNWKRLL